jgi:hypothetical protein
MLNSGRLVKIRIVFASRESNVWVVSWSAAVLEAAAATISGSE